MDKPEVVQPIFYKSSGVSAMRETIRKQLHLGQVDIGSIKFDSKSRDDIPQLLKGLQHLYVEDELREQVFDILEEITPEDIDANNGRPGMERWIIFVAGCLRLDLNIDYDRLHDLMNNHVKIRQMLGHGSFDDEYEYQLQTIKDNVELLTPKILDRISQIVVGAGQQLLKKKTMKLLKANVIHSL